MNKPQVPTFNFCSSGVVVTIIKIGISPVWWEGNPCNSHLVQSDAKPRAENIGIDHIINSSNWESASKKAARRRTW